jgi:hypothetical protein
VKDGTFEVMRVWAAITGLLLALGYFVELYMGLKPSETMPMLVAGIGGFELMLFGQDMMRKRKHG